MKKTKLAMIILVLTAFILTSFSVPIFASSGDNDVVISPMLTYINEAEADIYLSGSTVTARTNVVGYSGVTSCSATIRLQEKDGNRWRTIKSWTSASKGRTLRFSDTHTVSSGTYRVQSTVTAYSGSDKETLTLTTGTKTKK